MDVWNFYFWIDFLDVRSIGEVELSPKREDAAMGNRVTALVKGLSSVVGETPVTDAVASDEQHFAGLFWIVMAQACEVVGMVVVHKQAWPSFLNLLDV